jgi:hypothetical protein
MPYTCSGHCKNPRASFISVTLIEYICRVLPAKAAYRVHPVVLCVKCIGLNEAAAMDDEDLGNSFSDNK